MAIYLNWKRVTRIDAMSTRTPDDSGVAVVLETEEEPTELDLDLEDAQALHEILGKAIADAEAGR